MGKRGLRERRMKREDGHGIRKRERVGKGIRMMDSEKKEEGWDNRIVTTD
jgi:hypothetical protein